MIPPASTAIGRLLRLPLRLVPANRVVRIVSGALAGHRWITGSAPHGCWVGTYERGLQAAMARWIVPGQVVYDIGANAGFFTLLAAKLTGDAGRVVAVEPLERNLGLLRRHLALNQVANVHVVAAAVADRPGVASFTSDESPSMGRLAAGGQATVQVTTIDAIVAAGELPPDVMKMDIEGGEVAAIAGGRETLTRHRPLLFLSTHGYAAHQACCTMLEQLGYSLELRRDGAADGQYEVVATPRD